MEDLMQKIVSLAKRRGFVFPGSEIYGGLANSLDYGPLGVELKNNIAQLWWKRFVQTRNDMVGIDGSIISHQKIWEASGHLSGFSDLLLECPKCKTKTITPKPARFSIKDNFSKYRLKIKNDNKNKKF